MLAVELEGLSNEGKNAIRKSFSNIETKDESLINLSEESESTIEQSVEKLLRGFVVHEVFDDTDNSTIYISIVTTPKTRG